MKSKRKICLFASLLAVALFLSSCGENPGAFSFIYEAFGAMLRFFNQITGSYALALLIYALVFKVVFLPFSIKQQKNQIAMAKLRPRMAQIEKKYAGRNDTVTRQKMQQEMMELQQQEGFSPLSGCLPLLLQFPIIIFLYAVIRQPLSYICGLDTEQINALIAQIGYTYEGQLDQIALLNAIKAAGVTVENMPDFTFLGMNLADYPSLKNFSILVLIPVLAAASQWLTMFLTKKWQGTQPAADPQTQMSTKMMDFVFPAMTLFIAFKFSAMLGLYWIYQSILGIAQTFILMKTMPLPKYTAEELKEMERAAKEKAKAQRSAMNAPPTYKSLHYIDEDDADSLPDMRKTAKDSKSKAGIESGNVKDNKD